MIRLKLAEGRDPVPQEDGSPWPAEGIEVEQTTLYQRRRLKDGDLVQEEAEPAAAAPPAQAEADPPAKSNPTGARRPKGE